MEINLNERYISRKPIDSAPSARFCSHNTNKWWWRATKSEETSKHLCANFDGTHVHPGANSRDPCALVRRIRIRAHMCAKSGPVCTRAQNRVTHKKKLARKGRHSNSHCFSCFKISSFRRFPAWGHTKGLLYPQSSNAKLYFIASFVVILVVFVVFVTFTCFVSFWFDSIFM